VALSLGQPVGASKREQSGTPDTDVAAALAQSARELDDEDPSLKEALARSMADRDEEELKLALQMSMENGDSDSQPSTSGVVSQKPKDAVPASTSSIEPPNPADLRAKRSAFLDRLQNNAQNSNEKEDQK